MIIRKQHDVIQAVVECFLIICHLYLAMKVAACQCLMHIFSETFECLVYIFQRDF